MAKRVSRSRQYLEQHRGLWRVTVPVPRHLHKELGTRIKRPLHTDSLTIANQLKGPVVIELKHLIANHGKPDGHVADEFRRQREAARSDDERALVDDGIEITAETMRGPEVATSVDPETGEEVPVYDPKKEAAAGTFMRLARGEAVPVDHLHLKYLDQLKVKPRTKADDERAMRLLKRWCEVEGIAPLLQSFPNKKVAVRFMDALPTLPEQAGKSPVTLNKYLRRLSAYWQWLERRDEVPADIWQGVTLAVPKVGPEEKERPFSREEMAALLSGPASPEMHDLMRIASLTGCRLDPIVCLRVKDCREDGVFVFKPQKKEQSARLCPIHSSLKEIVERRTRGKKPDDPVFPEWPMAKNAATSMRERSFKASNEFTAYRRSVGVADERGDRRRSLVNFHSFRRWFITEAERANQPPHFISAVVGHKREGMTLGVYSAGPLIEQVREVVEAVRLPFEPMVRA